LSWYFLHFDLLFTYFSFLFIFQNFTKIDINECNLGIDNCHLFATCTNTQGSFTCQCNLGYFGDGFSCTEEGFDLIIFLIKQLLK